MGSKSPKAAQVKMPDDPDPTPIASNDSTPEVQGAARDQRKKIAKNYGRQNTILAGNTASNVNAEKKTILGG